jgi:hypothetical protein
VDEHTVAERHAAEPDLVVHLQELKRTEG